ncbi:asparagine synthase (glutamine-hydrolyzing) [Candidatus Wolfebacteria bacterium]|nr:asparagine synthase (glutamine-hydrolyzing) [Candidatus Wolfebacteria bacterium]
MCGIAGIYHKNADKKEFGRAIERMNQSQFRRGPDDEGVFLDEKNGVVFGHRRLSILDLSKAGHQPMMWQMANGKWQMAITFNGEIYNFQELRRDLEKKKYKFKTKTDTEVILALYAEYGEKSFGMLRGMFAFGLWDGKNRKLFLVKDRYGIKPLYYYDDSEKLVFASTVKAIAESGLMPAVKNPDAYVGFLLFGSVPLPMTTIKNIFAVPTGHYLVKETNGNQVNGNQTNGNQTNSNQKLVKYYDPLEFMGGAMTRHSAKEENKSVKTEVRRLLEESVNSHLISDAPLGVFLSGGLDSSAIAALSAEALREGGVGRKIATLSIIFDEPEFSEQKYQRLVAQKIGSDHREIKITRKDFEESFNEVFEAMDQPTIDGVNSFFIAKAAKEAGLKAVLSGLGADEIFLGYPHFRKAELLRKIQKLPKILKSPLYLASLFGDRWSKLNYFTNSDDLSFYLGIRGLFSPQETARILDINLSEVNNFIYEFNNSLVTNYQLLITKLHPVNLLSYLELKFYLQNQLLKDTDFMSMYHSIEVRVPFLDHPLVEYLSGLSPRLKLKNLKTEGLKNINKPLLVGAICDLLPPEIFTRPKMGFTFPFQKWFKESSLITNYQLQFTNQHWSRFWAMEVLNKF